MSERNQWIARHLLPHQPALRRYLAAQKLPTGVDADDIVQEIYGRFADMDSVSDIRDGRDFMIGVGRNILLMQMRRARVVPIRAAESTPSFDPIADEPSPEVYASDRQQLHPPAHKQCCCTPAAPRRWAGI